MEFGFTLIFFSVLQIVSLTAAFFLGYYIDKVRFEKSIEHQIEKAKKMGKKMNPYYYKTAVSIKLKRNASTRSQTR